MNNAEQAEKEYRELVEQTIKKNDEALKRIKAEGRHKGGLDGRYEELIAISREHNRKINEIREKYGFPRIDFKGP